MDFKDKVVVITGKERVWAESFTDEAWDKVAQDDWSFDKLKPIADQYERWHHDSLHRRIAL